MASALRKPQADVAGPLEIAAGQVDKGDAVEHGVDRSGVHLVAPVRGAVQLGEEQH